ncbi:MAG: hypothetical protein K0Q64_1718 [Nitrobacter vulgaris]|nr:hypothetical protein [Nitrobacter vulgaris]
MLPYREPRQSGAGVALACCRAVSFDVRLGIHLSLSEPRIVSADFEGRWRAFDILQTGKGAIRHRDRVRSTADLARFFGTVVGRCEQRMRARQLRFVRFESPPRLCFRV